jgi:hypothetical protein
MTRHPDIEPTDSFQSFVDDLEQVTESNENNNVRLSDAGTVSVSR